MIDLVRMGGDSDKPTHLPHWSVSRPLVTTGLTQSHMLPKHLDTKEITHGTFLLLHHTSEFREIDSSQADDEFWRGFFQCVAAPPWMCHSSILAAAHL